MIVVFLFAGSFVTGLTVTELPLGSNPAGREELERPMHGCIADIRVLLAQPQVHVLGRQVRVALEKFIEA